MMNKPTIAPQEVGYGSNPRINVAPEVIPFNVDDCVHMDHTVWDEFQAFMPRFFVAGDDVLIVLPGVDPHVSLDVVQEDTGKVFEEDTEMYCAFKDMFSALRVYSYEPSKITGLGKRYKSLVGRIGSNNVYIPPNDGSFEAPFITPFLLGDPVFSDKYRDHLVLGMLTPQFSQLRRDIYSAAMFEPKDHLLCNLLFYIYDKNIPISDGYTEGIVLLRFINNFKLSYTVGYVYKSGSKTATLSLGI